MDTKKIPAKPRVRMSSVDFCVSASYLWQNFYEDILAIIRCRSRCSRDQAIDISHSLYVTLVRTRRIERWTPGGGCSLSTWFVMSVRSYLSAEARHNRRCPTDRLPADFDCPSGDSASEFVELNQIMQAAHGLSNPDQQRLLWLMAGEYPPKEIRRTLGVSPEELKLKIKKIRKIFTKALDYNK